MTTDPGPPRRANLQGLIVRGYTHPYSTHMLFHFPARDAAAAFVKSLLPYLQSAADWGTDKPTMMLNIGLTCDGLAVATSLTDDDFKQFPHTFSDGPVSVESQQSLFDLGDSAPSNWWAQRFSTSDLHCVVHSYALDAESMAAMVARVVAAASSAGVQELFPMADGKSRLVQGQLPIDEIQFGYRDGISEPALAWPVAGQPPEASTLDNFVIGYPGAPFEPGPSGDNAAGRFAKDGCYNAFRVISQDVAEFERFLDENAPAVVAKLGKTTAEAREWLAAKVIGRWRNGSPLEMSPDAPDEATRDGEDFDYVADPPTGIKCPFSAHIRVANPRKEKVDIPVPRLIRRGVPYGPPPGTGDGSVDRGLIGLFLCGGLASQFELLYGWMNTNGFSDVFGPDFDTQDAVVANRAVPGADPYFRIPTANGEIKVSLPEFLTTRGTAYCLLPSIASLHAIAVQTV
jgi:deferrochelatase/peroxidase EfeB